MRVAVWRCLIVRVPCLSGHRQWWDHRRGSTLLPGRFQDYAAPVPLSADRAVWVEPALAYGQTQGIYGADRACLFVECVPPGYCPWALGSMVPKDLLVLVGPDQGRCIEPSEHSALGRVAADCCRLLWCETNAEKADTGFSFCV